MRKLFALYTNEMIKISKKVSVIVMLAIMVAVIFGFGGLMKFQDNQNKGKDNNYNYELEFQKDEMNRQLESAKTRIAEIQKKKGSVSEDELKGLEAEERSNQNQVDMLQYAIDRDILLYTNNYRDQAVQKLFRLKDIEGQINSIPVANQTEEQKKQLSDIKTNTSALEKVIENKNFKEFITLQNKDISSNTNMSEEEKKIYIESNELRLKYNITGEQDGKVYAAGNANNYIYQIENGKRSLLHDLDYTGNQSHKPLTEEQREKIKDSIAVIEYKFEEGIISNTSTNNFGMDVKSIVMPGMLGIGIFMVSILGMILAGGSISSEISTGSIKSLIISPTKRWKIYTAKALSLITVGIIATLIAYVFSVVANGVYFGFNSGTPYIYANNGVAHELNFYFYQFATIFTNFINVLVFMTFAFMLSIITRNTAASVAISIAVLFVGSNANAILMQFTKGEWRKFIPFNNLEFTSKIFPNDELMQVAGNMPGVVNNSLLFSSIYVVILLLCMGYVGLDSFNRRDIK